MRRGGGGEKRAREMGGGCCEYGNETLGTTQGSNIIKMTNRLRLTHLVLLVRGYMLPSLVTIVRPFCESILKMLDYILGSQVCIQFLPVYICHINTLKSGDKMVIGK